MGIELDPRKMSSDTLTSAEIKEICDAVTARNLGDSVGLSEFATPNSAAFRKYPDKHRSGAHEYKQNPFQEDVRRGSFCNAYERLARKTQVITNPTRDHITSRLIHADRVAQISRAIARALGANEDLTEAIGRLHDIGHAPLGHLGEELITRAIFDSRSDFLGVLGMFKHNVQGVHVVDRIAVRRGFPEGGLNLTSQVKHGVLSHDGEAYVGSISPNRNLKPEELDLDIQKYITDIIRASGDVEFDGDHARDPRAVNAHMEKVATAVKKVIIAPATIEACIVFIVDVLHYCPEDWEDIIALGEAERSHLPLDIARRLGTNGADMMHTMITDLIVHSYGKDAIGYSKEVAEILTKFKKDVLYPYYYKINSWAYSDAADPRVNLPAPRGRLMERMEFLFQGYLCALRDPRKHPDSSIVKGYLSGCDVRAYLNDMGYGDDEACLHQVVIDYISGFTDNFFFSESENMFK